MAGEPGGVSHYNPVPILNSSEIAETNITSRLAWPKRTASGQLRLSPQFTMLASTFQTMRKSSEVKLTILAAVALSMTACRTEHRDCVDPQNRKEPDSY